MKAIHMMTIGALVLLLAVAPACVTDDSSANGITVTNWDGLKNALAAGGNMVKVDADIHIVEDCELQSGKLIILSDRTITVDEECLFTANGAVNNYGTIVNNGYTVINGEFQSFEGSEVINNYVWAGAVPETSYIENGERIEITLAFFSEAVGTIGDVSAVYFYVPTSFDLEKKTTITLGNGSAVSIPNAGLSPGALVTVLVTETKNTSDVEGVLYSVKVDGVNPGTELTIMLPSSSPNDKVYHVVDGVRQGEMRIISWNSGFVTFTVNHNSEFAVGTVFDENRTYHDVTIDSGVGFIVNKTGAGTQTGTFVFKVMPRDGYEITGVHATNGDVARNGNEYTLSNVTADTTVYVTTAEVVEDTPQDDTAEYTVIGAAVGLIVMLGLAATLLFGKKP